MNSYKFEIMKARKFLSLKYFGSASEFYATMHYIITLILFIKTTSHKFQILNHKFYATMHYIVTLILLIKN
jgi:hypothetical protein